MLAARVRARTRTRGAGPATGWREQLHERLVGQVAPGRSFADAGGMWGAHGRVAFLAEQAGAGAVTLLDASPETEEFDAERERRSSKVRFVRGDINDPAALEQVGEHDVVWCSGVLYHAPDPHLTLSRLASIARETLVIGSITIPELPGVDQGCVFYPGLSERQRAPYAAVAPPNAIGLTTPFDPTPERAYANYWWGITPSALRAMVATIGFEVVEAHAPTAFEVHLVARRS